MAAQDDFNAQVQRIVGLLGQVEQEVASLKQQAAVATDDVLTAAASALASVGDRLAAIVGG